MARQSASPKRAAPSQPRRRFTLQQANSTLPLVKRIVSDIVNTHALATQLHSRLDAVSANGRQAIQAELETAIEQLQGYVDELTDVGCELKDVSTGLVDFVGRHQGRDVYLCWKLGEEKIEYWHDLTAGFIGRQPIATLEETP